MTTGARGDQGSCDGAYTEVRLSLEDSRWNVGKKGKVKSLFGPSCACDKKIDWCSVRSKTLPDQAIW